ncbi:MAG TPA: hypothetical protein VJ602_05625 [Paludibacter sp.]|nr:hypothetical protein [Paludibacter sp.]
METVVNQTTEVPKTSKRHFDTMDESIAKMKQAFGNASLPEIFVVMVTVGYNAEKIDKLNADLMQLETLYQAQIKEYGDEDAEQQKFTIKRAEVNKTFVQHRGLSRILFKDSAPARVALQLDVEIPKAYPAWIQLISNFYAQLSVNPVLQMQASAISLTLPVVSAQKQAIADLQALKGSLLKETGEAQAATDARDAAFDALFEQYTDYIKYAKVLLPDNQLLEALGVTVK